MPELFAEVVLVHLTGTETCKQDRRNLQGHHKNGKSGLADRLWQDMKVCRSGSCEIGSRLRKVAIELKIRERVSKRLLFKRDVACREPLSSHATRLIYAKDKFVFWRRAEDAVRRQRNIKRERRKNHQFSSPNVNQPH